jgi:hypothetical protein
MFRCRTVLYPAVISAVVFISFLHASWVGLGLC